MLAREATMSLINVASVLMNGTRKCMALGERDGSKEKAANHTGPKNPQIYVTIAPHPCEKANH